MRLLSYLAAFIIPCIVAFSLYMGGAWSFLAFATAFGFFPVVELFLKGTNENLEPTVEETIAQQRRYDLLIYSMVPVQYGLLALFLTRVASGTLSTMELIGAVLSMGVACGVLGINVAHDLGHRRKTYEQNLAKSLLLTSLYMHFFIEHNRGHHARVATHEDPATSRRGESIFQFLPRSVAMGWVGAWKLELRRLKIRGEAGFGFGNQMLRFQFLQVAFVAVIFLAFGVTAGFAFVAAALLGAVMLETVNYVEHYGLRRERNAKGRFERVRPAHSWNSNHPVGRVILFELTRHSDHHANARRKYQVLRHFDESPQLPTGYPGMMVLAWCPPLWFAVMHRELDRIDAGEPTRMMPAELAAA